MRKKILFLILLVCALSLFGDVRKITILQTTDIHSNFGEANPASLGNWLKLSSLIKTETVNAGGRDKVLLIDCGDILQGSFDASISKGDISISMMNQINYDAWILGNHDFDFGIKRLLAISKKLNADIFAGNLKFNNSDFSFRAWKIYRKNGLKIALLGLTYPELHNYLWKYKKDFYVFSLEKSITRFMPDIIKENPDLIVLAVHYGETPEKRNIENDISEIAKKHPEINLILGGHFHADEPGRIVGSKIWYGSAGKHAEKLFKAEAEIDTDSHKVNYVKSSLVPVLESTPVDETARKALAGELGKTGSGALEEIGKSETVISGTPESGSPVSKAGELLCRAMASAAGTKLAFMGPPSKDDLPLNITAMDLFRFLPYEDSITTLELDYNTVCDIIAEQLKRKNLKDFQQPWGFYVDADRQGNIKSEIRFADGSLWQDKEKRFKIAFSSYVLGGAGGKFPALRKIADNPANKASSQDILIRDALKEYISENSPLRITATEWIKFVK